MPTELLVGLFGFVLGAAGAGGLVFFLTMSQQRAHQDAILNLREERGAAVARGNALDDNFTRLTAECDRVRRELRKYERDWTSATTRLSEAQKNINEQKALVEQAINELLKKG